MDLITSASSGGVQYCNFNLPQDLFVAATRQGFTVYRTDPFMQTVQRSIAGGVIRAELLERTNFMALISQKYPERVHIWDDMKMKVVTELDFETISPLKTVRLRRDILICVLINEVRIYTMKARPSLILQFPTTTNPKGLIAVSSGSNIVIGFPARQIGFLQIVKMSNDDPAKQALSEKPNIMIVSVHSSELSCISTNAEGTLIATASDTGTLVRVWRTANASQLTELRRGLDHADIQSMSFSQSHTSPRLAVVSDKGTAHVFNLPVDGNDNILRNKASAFSRLANFGIATRYFGSSWSAYQAKIEQVPGQDDTTLREPRKFLVAWVTDRTFVVLASDGGYWKYLVPDRSKAGETSECSQESYRIWTPHG